MNIECSSFKTDKTKKEIQAHGTVEFPCAIYYAKEENSSTAIVPWHWHEEFEVIYIKDGKCKIQTLGKEYFFDKGTVVVINAKTLHFVVGNPIFVLKSFVFSPLLITGDNSSVFYRKYISPLIASNNFSLWSSNNAEDLCYFEKAYSAQRDKVFAYEFIVRENLSSLLLSLYKDLEKDLSVNEIAKDRDSVRIEAMLRFIHENFSDSITLFEIGESASLSEREALRCFRRTINESPIQYLSKYRLMKGADMLLESSDKSISDIAIFCGFESFSYFSKQFKRYYHTTPSEYRKSTVPKGF